jgi:glutamate dehydrogenase/leucine dehydrogenase
VSSNGSALELARELGHETVVLLNRPEAGLRAVIALHDTTFGPAIGGTRMREYAAFEDAVRDALLLSRAMTSKAVFAGMACGGGKAVIVADPLRDKTAALLEAYGEAVEELAGRFFTGGDMGVDERDLLVIARRTSHVGHVPSNSPIDASDLTARGVVAAMRTVAARLGKSLGACQVAVQGVGEVGRRLTERLAGEGVEVVVTDTVASRADAVARSTGAKVVAAGEIAALTCDILSPNAAGGAIDEALAASMPCRAVVGAANNPLISDRAGEILHERGVLYAPDYVVNAGGLLSVLYETGELDVEGVTRRVERIGTDLGAVLDEAERDRLPPFRVADRIVAERLAAGRAARAATKVPATVAP